MPWEDFPQPRTQEWARMNDTCASLPKLSMAALVTRTTLHSAYKHGAHSRGLHEGRLQIPVALCVVLGWQRGSAMQVADTDHRVARFQV